jgi:hypothetical protein
MVRGHEASGFVPYAKRIRDFFDRWPGCKVGVTLSRIVSWVGLFSMCQEPVNLSSAAASGEAGGVVWC